jgi:lipopolysaccharide biosynthesis glycosyltransferase
LKTCLSTVCDKEFLISCSVMIKSFIDNNPWFSEDIVILSDELDEKDINYLKSIYNKTFLKEAKSVNLKNNFYNHMLKTYIKFQIFDLCKNDYDRVVFIDSDCLIMGDLKELFLINAPFSVCSELDPNHAEKKVDFNTGVMVINKDLGLYSEKLYNLHSETNEFNHHGDQTILNKLICSFNLLPTKFNTLKTNYRFNGSWLSDVRVLHYISKKPWQEARSWHLGGNFECLFLDKYWWDFYMSKFDVKFLESREMLLDYVKEKGLTKKTVEIGVYKGDFSKKILNQINPDEHWAIDPWEKQENYQDIVNSKNFNNVYKEAKENLCDRKNCNMVRDYGENYVDNFEDSSLDFVYIDARHDYDSVLKDIKLWYPKVRKGGIIAGHDYLDGEYAFEENKHSTVFGVKKAVDEFFGEEKIRYTMESLLKSWFVVI